MSDTSAVLMLDSREQLLAALGEAAEIEHNLMCCYLYAVFSLKRDASEDLEAHELEAIARWRDLILGVAIEEMTHLTLVANLTSALGSTPHFQRPNFPVSPGLYPAGVVIELAPFSLDTLDHFIFLERPAAAELADGAGFLAGNYHRATPARRLMPFGGDYETVGALYAAIRDGLERQSVALGESALFCGDPDLQVRPADCALPGLVAIRDLDCAQRALATIVVQGEGSTSDGDSHFARFRRIKDEYLGLLARRPGFVPGRNAARNPVMRPPVSRQARVHVTAEPAGAMIDLANALYAQMLRLLLQVYAVPRRPAAGKRVLLESSFALMRAMAGVAERLTQVPADARDPRVTAGMSFATIRMTHPLEAGDVEATVLCERAHALATRAGHLAAGDPALQEVARTAASVEAALRAMPPMPASAPAGAVAPAAAPPPAAGAASQPPGGAAAPPAAGDGIEVVRGSALTIFFEAQRCIHSRHCVLGLPGVFLANTPGAWIRPDATSAARLVAVAEVCPSGAIRYQRHDGQPDEAPPPVNTLHLRENGPLAVHAPIVLRGQAIGYRATLCRCGRSNHKPYCDGSHVGAFVATGEPPSGEVAVLAVRDGPLALAPERNGPLHVAGNLEICAGTGRTVARVVDARLCRCGQSKNKPFCDLSHKAAGFVADA